MYRLDRESFLRDRHGREIQDSMHTPMNPGTLTILPNAAYSLEFVESNGSHDRTDGTISIDNDTLRFTMPDGMNEITSATRGPRDESLLMTVERPGGVKLNWVFVKVRRAGE